MLIKLWFLFCIPLVLVSCSKDIEFEKVKVKSVTQTASLPEDLIRKLSQHFKTANPEIKMSEDKIFNKFGFYSKEIWPINVRIWSDKTNAREFNIFDAAVRLDLNSYLTENKDVQKFNFSIEIKTQNFNKLYVYFVPSLKNKNEKCEKFYEITNFYFEELSQKVMFTRETQHYLKNYIGTYLFFSSLNKNTYQMNLLQITDSSQSEQLCTYF